MQSDYIGCCCVKSACLPAAAMARKPSSMPCKERREEVEGMVA